MTTSFIYSLYMPMDKRVEVARAQWREIQEKYGNFVVVDDPADLPAVEKNRIWTEFWRQDQYITNLFFEVDDFDGDVTSYFVFDRCYSEPENSIFLTTVFWDDCEDCDGDDEECATCEGNGSIAVDVL